MITKLNRVKKLGVFEDFVWNGTKLTDFAKRNLLYAYNGGGKTTLSNVFRLFSSTETEDQKKEIFHELSNGEDTLIEIEADGKKISFKPDKPQETIYVFNCDFITEHICDGTASKLKRFRTNIKSNLKDKEINELEKKIDAKVIELFACNEKITKLITEFERVKKLYSADFGKKISNKRLTNIVIEPLPSPIKAVSELETDLDIYIRNYNISLELEQLKADLELLKQLKIKPLLIVINEILEALTKDILNDSSDRIKAKIINYKEVLNEDQGGIEAWYKDGQSILEHICEENEVQHCPLCHTNITSIAINLLNEYQTYFNAAYVDFIKLLDTIIQNISICISNISENNDTINQLKAFLLKYSTTDYSNTLFETKGLIESLQQLKQTIERKKSNVKEDVLTRFTKSDISSVLKSYDAFLTIFSSAQAELISTLEKQNLDPDKLLTAIKILYRNLILATFDKGDNVSNNISHYYKSFNEKEQLEKEIDVLNSELSKARAKLKSEAKHVNRYLKQLGIHHFTIDVHDSKPSENIEIIFESGTKKSKLKHSISDGEKTALCLAYFLSKLEHEVFDNADAKIEDCVVLLDDPVTSLDENRLYTTACIIDEKFGAAKQLFVLSHNLVFMKFLGNIMGHKDRSDYFLSNHRGQVCLENLPYALTNYTTVYFQKLDDINLYSKGDLPYIQGKNFIPNNIRVVLEAFLSFKFCLLKDGSSRDSKRVAGLEKLIERVNTNINSFKDFPSVGKIDSDSIISRLRKIKLITDPQSHGSPESIHSFNFINENELKEIAEDTLNIIHFFDKMHFQKATEN